MCFSTSWSVRTSSQRAWQAGLFNQHREPYLCESKPEWLREIRVQNRSVPPSFGWSPRPRFGATALSLEWLIGNKVRQHEEFLTVLQRWWICLLNLPFPSISSWWTQRWDWRRGELSSATELKNVTLNVLKHLPWGNSTRRALWDLRGAATSRKAALLFCEIKISINDLKGREMSESVLSQYSQAQPQRHVQLNLTLMSRNNQLVF